MTRDVTPPVGPPVPQQEAAIPDEVSSAPAAQAAPAAAPPAGGYVVPFGDIRLTPHVNNRTAWLMSFIDLTGILVGFFVLVYSTQTIDRASWQEVAGSFKAAFAANPTAVVPVTPQGSNNALQVVAASHDVLPYLDSLLRLRLKNDPLWATLKGRTLTTGEHVMLYALPPDSLDVADPQVKAAWTRLADVVRGWKNPVAIRVTVPPLEQPLLLKNTTKAITLARILAESGVSQVAAEVVSGKMAAVELVVKAER